MLELCKQSLMLCFKRGAIPFLFLFLISFVSADPTVTTGNYVSDNKVVVLGDTSLYLRLTGGTMQGDIDMDNYSIHHANWINTTYTNISINYTQVSDPIWVETGGDTMTGDLIVPNIYGDLYGTVYGSWNGSGNYVPYTGATSNVDLGSHNFTAENITTDNFIVNEFVLSHLLPSPSLTWDLGSGANRWNYLYVTDISADNIDATYGITTLGNVTADTFISSGDQYCNSTDCYFIREFLANSVYDDDWINTTMADTYLDKSGDTMTGDLIINADLNVTGNITADYIHSKNYVTQYHRNASIDTSSADTWINVTWDLKIDEETTSGYSLIDSDVSIVIEHTGIYRIQGCLHPKNNDVGNQEASLYSRVLINGVEAKCLQFANSKEFKTKGIDTMPFIGTLYAEAGQKVQLQYYITNINIDFEGDAVFDDAVAGSINFERISQ